MFEFRYDHINSEYDKSKLLFTDRDSKILAAIKKCLINKVKVPWWFKKISLGKMKDESGGVVIKEFVWLKPNMYFVFVNRSVVATISYNEY